MSKGTLYANEYTRGIAVQGIIKYYNLPFDIVYSKKNTDFEKNFPMLKIPALITPEGIKLQEVIPLTIYVVKQIPDELEKRKLLTSDDDLLEALQGKFLSLSNTDFFMNICYILMMSLKFVPWHQDIIDRAWTEVNNAAEVFSERLSRHSYLVVDDHITVADLICATQWAFCCQNILGKPWRDNHPGIDPWVLRVIRSPILKDYFSDFTFAEKNCDEK
ncbi:hypothetical protein TBLA_0J01020 [Henningerozyma blattae CBS 6284]|uniref:GST C-terminal domain-containing protein n=1 Tax=Henningerozyma blattae (strain ATCC 34711 / CBS 6284 / DSM 70876 / NBRC 10599 / NRRL Y-10934 / UCD 77-7) TaxID=1071380 RepID=I2H9P8_HENB6|nr:hypothetical protein TBLA_0J01020 [Tetrapisispora blattae CBS 6284]CCH63100.1 hypothetical protein TBLA_0J01020 [Tetrapisispora blattae CBS 6284]